jgi:hypothetical protein
LWDGKDAEAVKASVNNNRQQQTTTSNKPKTEENAAVAHQFSRTLIGLGVLVAVFGVIMG